MSQPVHKPFGDTNAASVALSLGANLGERAVTLDGAVEMIAAIPETIVQSVSTHYATEPVGVVDQPEFLNMAMVVQTQLEPMELLKHVREVERKLGRVDRRKWHEREIDIDILLFDTQVIDTEHLQVPHPHMHNRRFVLEPLAEIAPDMMHPVLQRTVARLLEACEDTAEVRRGGEGRN